jgi:hypothetical protein
MPSDESLKSTDCTDDHAAFVRTSTPPGPGIIDRHVAATAFMKYPLGFGARHCGARYAEHDRSVGFGLRNRERPGVAPSSRSNAFYMVARIQCWSGLPPARI